MKKVNVLIIALLMFSAVLFQGCGAFIPTPMGFAGLYTSITCPSEALAIQCNENAGTSKVGKASATNILGIISTGDFSLQAAMMAGGIKKVHHVDVKVENVLGLFSTKTIIVYGE